MRPKAPPLAGDRWLECAPIPPDALVGRPTVLLFWAQSCEGSWARLDHLAKVQARHGDDVAIVAVHSPRFEYERSPEVVAAAVAHQQVPLPVLLDPDLETWARYAPEGRPTVVVIDASQRVVGAMTGTDPASSAALDEIIDDEVARGRRSSPLPTPRATPRHLHRLVGPSSVARLRDGRVAIADRGNGRLVVATLDGQGLAVDTVFGGLDGVTAVAARSDGTVAVSRPARGSVESLDPTTKDRHIVASELLRPTGLVEDRDGSLVVAESGADRLHRIAPGGRRGVIADGNVSQPVGITRLDTGILVTEGSTGAVRLLTDRGRVVTVNDGTRPGLVDGPIHRASMQRPTGLATMDGGRIAIADTGNGRIRLLRRRRLTTIAAAGLAHPLDVLYLGNDRLLVTDTNADRLVCVDLAAQRVTPIEITGLPV